MADQPPAPASVGEITRAAATSVEGFLRNIALGTRRAQADGGRGTRRKVEMYTSLAPVNAKSAHDSDTQLAAGVKKSDPVKAESTSDIGANTPSLLDDDSLFGGTFLQDGDGEGDDGGEDGADWEEYEGVDTEDGGPLLADGNSDTVHVKGDPGNSSGSGHGLLKRENDAQATAATSVAAPPWGGPPNSGSADGQHGQATTIGGGPPAFVPDIGLSAMERRDPAYAEMIAAHQAAVAKARSERLAYLRREVTRIALMAAHGMVLFRVCAHLAARLEDWDVALLGGNTLNPIAATVADLTQKWRAAAQHPVKKTHAPTWVMAGGPQAPSPTAQVVVELLALLDQILPEGVGLGGWDGTNADRRHAVPLLSDLLLPPVGARAGKKRPREDDTIEENGGGPSTDSAQHAEVALHPAHRAQLFVALALRVGIAARLVVAVEGPQRTYSNDDHGDSTADAAMSSTGAEVTTTATTGSRRGAKPGKTGAGAGAALNAVTPSTSHYWVEWWCPLREAVVSTAPYLNLAVRFNAPYTFAFGGSATHPVVDVSARYGRYTAQYHYRIDKHCQHAKHILWPAVFGGPDYAVDRSRTPVSCLLTGLPSMAISESSSGRHEGPANAAPSPPILAPWLPSYDEREQQQLEKLLYSEAVPTTVTDVKTHPLYVLERDLKRHEGVYPRTVAAAAGTIRGALVFRRSSVSALRSRDGWLREGRALVPGTEPYKIVPPPASRPLGRPSHFYGLWQTVPFQPAPLTEQGHLPRHGNSNWYMVLGGTLPDTVAHYRRPCAAIVARRMSLDFRMAITGFRKREWVPGPAGRLVGGVGGYEPVAEGIIIRAADGSMFERAYGDYIALQEEQERRRRSQRARRWWAAFAQQLLASHRLQALFNLGNDL